MNFTQTFSEVPVCVPARRVMMTGKNRYGLLLRQVLEWKEG